MDVQTEVLLLTLQLLEISEHCLGGSSEMTRRVNSVAWSAHNQQQSPFCPGYLPAPPPALPR